MDQTSAPETNGTLMEELRTRAERLELVLKATNEGHWDWDLRTGEVYFSPRWKQMLGYRDDELPNNVEEWRTRLHPDDRAAVELSLDLYVRGLRDSFDIEHRLQHKDGSWRWIATRGTAVLDEHGHIVRIVGAHQDVTDRKRAELEVRRRAAILETVRFAAERFLTATTNWEESVQEVLKRLARATEVSRTYVFQNYIGDDGELWTALRHEWAGPGITPWIDNPIYEAIPIKHIGLGRWMETLRRGEIMFGHMRELPDSERPQSGGSQTLSYVSVPIFVEGTWWGAIGLDECVQERDFSETELDALKAAADTLGAAIARSKADETAAWLSAIVESSDDAIVGETLDRVITSWNTGAEQLSGYMADEAIGQFIEFLIPEEYRERATANFQQLRRGEMVPAFESERLRKDGSRVPVLVSLWPVRDRDGRVLGAASIARDITLLKEAEEALRRSQQSLSALMSNLPGMAYRSIPGDYWKMEFLSEGAYELTGYSTEELLENDGALYIGLIDKEERSRVRAEVIEAMRAGKPHHVTYRIRTASGQEKWVMEQGRGVREENGEVIAIEGIAMDVTERVKARQLLEQRVSERTRELTTLLEVAASVASTVELQPLIGVILEQFHNVVDYTGAAIFLVESDEALRLLDYRGPLTRSELSWHWPLDVAWHSREVIERREPVIIPDVSADTPLARAFRAKALDDLGDVPGDIASWMGVPLMLRDRVVGVLAVDHREHDAYSPRHAEIALAFASQAAVAIENAQLFEATQQKAALEERQRLARELHDSVSQALFGIGLGARTARSVIESDPERAIPPLDYVLSLAEAGLAEMRALIFELRPEALKEEGIVAALQKQVAALRARYGIEVEATLDAVGEIRLETEEALYRIAQEALHNTVKHARATWVNLTLTRDAGGIHVLIVDNGRGFDTSGNFPGHLGLHTMRERAERLGGTYTLTSAPGKGTRIEVNVPA